MFWKYNLFATNTKKKITFELLMRNAVEKGNFMINGMLFSGLSAP